MTNLKRYKKIIKELDFSDLNVNLPENLLIKSENDIAIYYAPFEYINLKAKVVIVGITPGKQQAAMALLEASKQLKEGKSVEVSSKAAKYIASFGGIMRDNLIKMLDFIGVQHDLGIETCADLFGCKSRMVHYTSALRYPVLKSGKNYNGTPSMLKNNLLIEQLMTYFRAEVESFSSDVLYIPLGEKVAEALNLLVKEGFLQSSQIKAGIPHPSGANAESIALFLSKDFPQKENYLNQKYQEYMMNKVGEKQQSEEKYKAARASRWKRIKLARDNLNIND